MLLAQKVVTKGGFRTFAAVSSNGGNAQLVYFAKFGAAPETGLWTEAQRMAGSSPNFRMLQPTLISALGYYLNLVSADHSRLIAPLKLLT